MFGGMSFGPSAIASRTCCIVGFVASRFVPAVPFVPASASVWQEPQSRTNRSSPVPGSGPPPRELVPQPASARTATTSRRALARTLEQHEQRELLVRGEAVLRSGLDEDRVAFLHVDRRAVDGERAAALEHDVDLVVVVRLLTVGLRGDEDVHAELD